MSRPIMFAIVMVAALAVAGCHQADVPTSMNQPPLSPMAPQGSYPLAGHYTLTLDLGSTCTVVPEADRIRTYSAAIEYVDRGMYVVTLSDAKFLTGSICTNGSGRFTSVGCNQFFASEDIDTAMFWLENNNDEAHGGHIVEQLSSGGWLEIIGYAQGPIGSNYSTIDASGCPQCRENRIWYCPTPSAYPFPCSARSCSAPDLRLTIKRK